MRNKAARGLRAMLAASVFMGLAGMGAASATTANTPTIRWDTYGVPHIYGADIPTVVKGLGYATMEAHAELMLNNVAYARGRSAEYIGPGKDNFNLQFDRKMRTYGIPARAVQWVATGGSFQKSVMQAFCDGVNEYYAKFPTDVPDQLHKMFPITPADIAALEQMVVWFTFVPEQSNLPGELADFQAANPGGSGVGVALAQPDALPTKARTMLAGRDSLPLRQQVAEILHSPGSIGSNGWAIGPSKSVTGNAMLMGNPHLPWGINQPIPNNLGGQNFGSYQWFETNLVVGADPANPTLNAQGVIFPGGPFLGIAFTDKIGWTHTNNTIKNGDLFKLTLDATGTKYKFGNTYLPLTHRSETIKILQSNGSLSSETLDIYTSVHGPVVYVTADHKQAIALRVPGLDQSSVVTQYWNMLQAQNVDQFKTAESSLQLPFFNTMFADSSGNIFYLFGGRQPVRSGGDWAAANTIQDGSDPTKLWTKYFSFSQLPQATNPASGWVSNCNNPPWNSVWPQPASLNPSSYPPYIAPNTMDFRAQHGANFFANSGKLARNDVLAGKMSTQLLYAQRVVDDLVAMAQSAGDSNAQAAAAILAAWDRTAEAGSVGGILFAAWLSVVQGDSKIVFDTSLPYSYSYPKFRTPWDPSNPFTTAAGLDPVNTAQVAADLSTAYQNMQTRWAGLGGASVPWGVAHRSTLGTRLTIDETNFPSLPLLVNSPQSAADGELGALRVVGSAFVPGGLLGPNPEYVSVQGDGYVQVIEFTPSGSVGGTLLGYGNASRPNSPHIADQMVFFDSKTLKPALRKLADVQAVTTKTESY